MNVQQGDVNITALDPAAGVANVHFSHMSLRTSSSGGCVWGYTLTNAVDSADGSDCSVIAAAGLDFDPLIMDVSQVVSPYAAAADGVHAAASTCSSPVTVLGRSGADVVLARFLLLFPCDGLNVPLQAITRRQAVAAVPSVMSPLTRIALELPADYSWQGRGTLPLLSLQSWPYSSTGKPWVSSAETGTDASYVITTFPIAPIAPWPSDAVIASSGIAGLLSELVVYNTSTLQVAWSLSADLRALSQPVVAIISNIALGPSGTMFFVAVRNVTSMPLPMRQWENSTYDVAVIAMDVNSANILWQSPIAPLNMMPIAPGVRLQLVNLAFSANALLFCAQMPDINITTAGNDTVLSLPASDFGIGAINTVGGELLWHDSTSYVYLPPDRASRWVSTRPAYCASNMVTDEKHVYAVVARRTSLGGPVRRDAAVGTAYSVGLQYALYCRASVDGTVMWTTLLGSVPPLTDSMVIPQVFSSTPNAGDVMALIRPFSLTFAPQRRLLLKYDASVVQTPANGAGQDSSSIVRVQSFQCQVQYPTIVSWVLLGVALFISVLVVRMGGGWLSVCVRVHLKAVQRERSPTGSALPPLASLPPASAAADADALPGDDRAQLLGSRSGGEAPTTSTSSQRRKRARKSKRPSSSRAAGDSAGASSASGKSDDGGAPSSGSRSSSTSRKKSSDSRRASGAGSVSSHGRSTDKEGNFGYVTPLVTTSSAAVRTSSLSRLRAAAEAEAASQAAAAVAAPTMATGYQHAAEAAAARPAAERPRLSTSEVSPDDSIAPVAAAKREVLNDIDDYCTIGIDTLCTVGIQALLEVPPAVDSNDGSTPTKQGSFSGTFVARSPAGRFSFNEHATPVHGSTRAPRASCAQRCGRCATALRPHVCPIAPGVSTTLLTILHYVIVLSLLSYGLSGARNSVAQLKNELSSPLRFYNSYLINRSPQPGAACASDAAAACYCTDEDSSGGTGRGFTTAQCNASYPATQRCDYDISACAVSCATVLQATGNCAASVFEYQCYCDADCTGTLFESNSTFRTAGAGGGLVTGLQVCSDHYSTITTVLSIAYVASCILGAIAMAVTLNLHTALWRCTRAAPSLTMLTMDAVQTLTKPAHEEPVGSGFLVAPSPSAGVRQTEPLLPAGVAAAGLRVRVPEDRQFVPGAFPRTPARSSRAQSFAASLLTPSPVTRSGHVRGAAAGGAEAADSGLFGGSGAATRLAGGVVPHAFASSAARRRYEAIHGSNPEYVGKSRAVGILVYLAIFQVGLFVGVFTWLYFLVIQGRYCTGADGDGAGTSAPLVGNESPPADSLILRYVPGCAFGSTWQDADLEGAALRGVWLAIAAQVVAVLLLITDQITALAYACGAQCRAVAKRPGLMHSLRARDQAQAGQYAAAFALCCACGRAAQRLWSVMDTTKIYVPDVWLEALGAHVLLLRWPCRCMRSVAARVGGAEDDGASCVRRACPCLTWIVSCGLPCFSVVVADVEDEDEYIDHVYIREAAPVIPAVIPSTRHSRIPAAAPQASAAAPTSASAAAVAGFGAT